MSFDLPLIQQYWDTWQRIQPAQGSRYTDWADHPVVFRELMKNAFGNTNADFFQFIKKKYPECTQSHALSLCCGDAGFEIKLLQQGVFERITGIDISTSRLEAAKNRIRNTTPPTPLTQWQLELECLDVNLGHYGSSCYDVVFAKAALHHLIDLEKSFEGIATCLKPGGLLIAIDYFGPSRFQWTDTQMNAANEFWSKCVPPTLKCDADGAITAPLSRPSVQQMLSLDPSEAARSDELLNFINTFFEIEHCIDLGGTLLNLILWGDRVNRFDAKDPAHCQILVAAAEWEHSLIKSGQIPSDFRFIIARKKPLL